MCVYLIVVSLRSFSISRNCFPVFSPIRGSMEQDVIASNNNRASICMFVCCYVNLFLLDGLHLGRQRFRD